MLSLKLKAFTKVPVMLWVWPEAQSIINGTQIVWDRQLFCILQSQKGEGAEGEGGTKEKIIDLPLDISYLCVTSVLFWLLANKRTPCVRSQPAAVAENRFSLAAVAVQSRLEQL